VKHKVNGLRAKKGLPPVSTYQVMKERPPECVVGKRRTDLCHICLNGDRTMKHLRLYLQDLKEKYPGLIVRCPLERPRSPSDWMKARQGLRHRGARLKP
jgi:hypothetical protein